jgi:hypothetical protein
MNKIKLMYDIARAMRDKDNLNGSVKLSLTKDGYEVFQMDNEFSRNFTNGTGRAKISTVLDHEGKQLQHESITEFNMNLEPENETQGCEYHRFLHKHHRGLHSIGLKKRLDIIIAALNALNNMKVLEQEGQCICLSLDLNEIPEGLKEDFRTHMIHRHHARPGFLSGVPVMEKGSLECRINKNHEIETITLKLEGNLQEENQPAGDINLDVAAAFAW